MEPLDPVNPKPKISPVMIVAVIILLVIIGGVLWYWQSRKAGVVPPTTASKTTGDSGNLGAQIFDEAQNPTKDEFPEANPFTADTNPFEAETNPFKKAYKNPF